MWMRKALNNVNKHYNVAMKTHFRVVEMTLHFLVRFTTNFHLVSDVTDLIKIIV